MNQKPQIKKRVGQAFGFTLAELLMVVVILGILSAVALPRFSPQKEKAYVSEAVGMLSAIRQVEEAYRLENGTYLNATTADTSWNKLGMGNPKTTYWEYTVTGANATAYTITATRLDKNWSGAGSFANQKITLNQAGVYGGDHPNKPS